MKKNKESRTGLRFDRIHEKLNYPKRFTDNIEKKTKGNFFLIKTIGFARYFQAPATAVSLFHGIFHGNLSSIRRAKTASHYTSCRIDSPFEN